jgi:hypothetical protein
MHGPTAQGNCLVPPLRCTRIGIDNNEIRALGYEAATGSMQSVLGTVRVGFHVSINGGDDICRSSRLDLRLLLVLVQQLTSSRAPRHTIKSRAELALITAYGVHPPK